MIFTVPDLNAMNGELEAFLQLLQRLNIPEEAIFNSRLVSCELITNVLRHCGEAAQFEGEVQGDKIRICVSSPNSVVSRKSVQPTLPDVFAEGGRGLYIVNYLCDGDVQMDGNGGVIVRIHIHRKS